MGEEKKEESSPKKEIVCPAKLDYLRKWSEQVPIWGKLEKYIEKCLKD